MGSMIGHVLPGFAFLVIGLWHLFNNIKLHALHPNSFISSPWFRAPSINYFELYLIIVGGTISISFELFIGPDRHQPLDPDWTIPSNHLHNFEHSLISMSFIIYAVFAILFDRIRLRMATRHDGVTYMLAAFAFGQQFFLFHIHSTDHMGVEGQYHLLLQLVVLVSLITTLMGIGFPNSFLVSFVRSISVFFQGVWFMVMGFMLWTPQLVSKGCFINFEDSHYVVRCHSDHALHRAKALVNLQFSWLLSLAIVFSTSMYIILNNAYGGKVEYLSINQTEEEEEQGKEETHQDVELQKVFGESRSFVHIGKGMPPIDVVTVKLIN